MIIALVSTPDTLPVLSALYIVLGTNIGTCVTAVIASVGANVNAKRAAFIHFMFNLLGTVIFVVPMLFLGRHCVRMLEAAAPGLPGMQIAYFHVLFNVISTAIMAPFIRHLNWATMLFIKEKKQDDDIMRLYYIDDRILQTPPIAVAQIIKEVLNMADVARDNLDRAFHAVISYDISERDKIRREEQKINFLNKGVAGYLVKTAALSLPMSDDRLIGSLHHVISDIERIGDHAENFLEVSEVMVEGGIKFSAQAVAELNEMYAKICEMFTRAVDVFRNRDASGLPGVNVLEERVDEMKRVFAQSHIARLNRAECSVESGTYFFAIITELERVADHLTGIAYSIKAQSGLPASALKQIRPETDKKAAEPAK
jgi:phosphate:Na+ symporter